MLKVLAVRALASAWRALLGKRRRGWLWVPQVALLPLLRLARALRAVLAVLLAVRLSRQRVGLRLVRLMVPVKVAFRKTQSPGLSVVRRVSLWRAPLLVWFVGWVRRVNALSTAGGRTSFRLTRLRRA